MTLVTGKQISDEITMVLKEIEDCHEVTLKTTFDILKEITHENLVKYQSILDHLKSKTYFNNRRDTKTAAIIFSEIKYYSDQLKEIDDSLKELKINDKYKDYLVDGLLLKQGKMQTQLDFLYNERYTTKP